MSNGAYFYYSENSKNLFKFNIEIIIKMIRCKIIRRIDKSGKRLRHL